MVQKMKTIIIYDNKEGEKKKKEPVRSSAYEGLRERSLWSKRRRGFEPESRQKISISFIIWE